MQKRKLKSKSRHTTIDDDDIEDRIKPVNKIEGPIKMVLYGRPKSGKTTFAASFPKPILLIDCNDKGTDSVSDVKGLDVFEVEEWEDFERAYWYLKKNGKKYKTILIDTVTGLQEIAIRKILKDAKKEDLDDPTKWGAMTQRDWGNASSLLKVWFTYYRDLKMNTVFIAHEKTSSVDDDNVDGEILPEVGPALMKSVATHINGAVNIIGNMFKREKVQKIKNKDTKKITEKRSIEYCLRIGDSSVYVTGIRKPKDVEVPGFLSNPTYEDLREIIDEE